MPSLQRLTQFIMICPYLHGDVRLMPLHIPYAPIAPGRSAVRVLIKPTSPVLDRRNWCYQIIPKIADSPLSPTESCDYKGQQGHPDDVAVLCPYYKSVSVSDQSQLSFNLISNFIQPHGVIYLLLISIFLNLGESTNNLFIPIS